MGLKPKNNGGDGSNVDWEAINASLDNDTYDARVAYVIDLGTQQRGRSVIREQDDVPVFTYVLDEDDAVEILSEGREIMGDFLFDQEKLDDILDVEVTKKNLETIQQDIEDAEIGEEVIAIPFRIVELKDAQEVAYIVDLVDHYVEYGDLGEKQFRVMLNNRDFTTGKLKGFALSVVKPKGKDGDWTYSALSMHSKLASATYTDLVAEDNDVSALLDKPLGIQVKKNKKGYPKFTPTAIPKKYLDDVPELDCEPLCITFDEATLEEIEMLKPNKMLVEKIQAATDYKGSAMEEALEEYLKSFKSKKKDKDEGEEEEEGESPKGRRNRKSKKEEAPVEEKKITRRKAKAKEVEEEIEEQEEEEKVVEEKPRRGRKPKTEPEKEDKKGSRKGKSNTPSPDPEDDDFDSDIPW